MTLEPPLDNNIRGACEILFRAYLRKRYEQAVADDHPTTWADLCWNAEKDAHDNICSLHKNRPPCIFEFSHVQHQVLHAQLKVEMAKVEGRTPEEHKEQTRSMNAARVEKAEEAHPGLEPTGKKADKDHNEWRCKDCGATGASNKLADAGHGDPCMARPATDEAKAAAAAELEKKTGFKVLDEKIGTEFKRQCIPCGHKGKGSDLKKGKSPHGLACKRAPVADYKPPEWIVELQAQAQIQVQVKKDDGFELVTRGGGKNKASTWRCKPCGQTGIKGNLRKSNHGLECKRSPVADYTPPAAAVEEVQAQADGGDEEMKEEENDGGGGEAGADDMEE